MMGVIVAAGRGSRMGIYTERRPKCLIRVGGHTLLDLTLEQLRRAGCDEIVIVTGYQRGAIERHLVNVRDVSCVWNPHAASTNLLHSLMWIGDRLRGPAYVTYADTIVSDAVYQTVLGVATASVPAPVAIAVDLGWRDYYAGRELHPVGEAEKVYVAPDGVVQRLGKHLPDVWEGLVGEFVGVMRASAEGVAALRRLFADVNAHVPANAPFQAARHWRLACLTDLLQAYIDGGGVVRGALVHRGWAELDTPEDVARLPAFAAPQGLAHLLGDAVVS